MKSFFGSLLAFFSFYASPFERKVARFFRSIKSTSSFFEIQRKLLLLMQENLVVVNIWMEKKYKGYKYLTKGRRRKMYLDSGKIVESFKAHAAKTSISIKDLRANLDELGLKLAQIDEVKLIFLAQIMTYLRPGLHYHYIKTSSFGKLLRDPESEKLEGDCNQIVTLYAYLYSLNFPLDDLKIKLLPNHVCLHFKGIDIEATNASFQNYDGGEDILPITELISTNMLDLNDFREDVQQISPRIFVKSAQLAYSISSLKEIVEKNLNIAYNNVARSALDSRDFDSALFFYAKAANSEMLRHTYRVAAIYYLEANDFRRALSNAAKLNDSKFENQIRYQQSAQEYNKLVQVVSGDKTLADLKRHKSIYKKMLQLALKMGDENLQTAIRKTLGQL